jgi:hypothetical protein
VPCSRKNILICAGVVIFRLSNGCYDLFYICTVSQFRKCILILISVFRRDVDEIYALLGYYAASCDNCLPTFRDNVSVPSSRVKSPNRKETVEVLLCPAYCVLPAVSCLLCPACCVCLLCPAYCVLPAVSCLLCPACCVLPAVSAFCVLPTVSCLLCPACCVLPTVSKTNKATKNNSTERRPS